VIFATVGSHPTFKFERLLRALEGLDGEQLDVQYGPGRPPANAAAAAPWMPFAEIVAQMERASHVVSHAGVGTILCAVGAGHVPIVFPRLRRFEETVDDHQLDLARKLEGTGRVVVVESAEALAGAVREAPPRGAAAEGGGGALIDAVAAELEGAQSSSR
jgi:UDP-N-acetylglucosamine transferase subunit ALG13